MRDETPVHLTAVPLSELITTASMGPVLDEADEVRLAQGTKSGDASALEALVIGNLRIAVDEAIHHRGLGTSQQHLARTAVVTLVEAARGYDPVLHGRFADHARARIQRALHSAIVTN